MERMATATQQPCAASTANVSAEVARCTEDWQRWQNRTCSWFGKLLQFLPALAADEGQSAAFDTRVVTHLRPSRQGSA
jgi:hypothetical protein